MKAQLLPCDRLESLIEGLLRDGEVIAPHDERTYGRIASVDQMVWGDMGPRLSLKEFFAPQREVLLTYLLEGRSVRLEEPPDDEGTRTILARPCDAAALPLLDRVFSWYYLDASYLERRRRTTIITIACLEPSDTCFCVSVDGSPAGTEGSDLLLTSLGEVYHAQIITERGEALVHRHAACFEDSAPSYDRRRAAVEDECRAKVSRTIDLRGISEALSYDSPLWSGLAEQCIDCSTCTFSCPTCHCFDIQDEGDPGGGERVRLWDSCASRDFTRTAVHQPRPTHASRYRQRVMHKFKYYPENLGRILCVGCGRCIRACPVGIDITVVLDLVRGVGA